MLLAVALGYGVVHTSLPRKTSLAVLALGVAYMIVSVLDSINRQTSYDIGPSTWEIPVLVLDFFFVGWIYVGLSKIKVELTSTSQHAKLGMYSSLTYVIFFNIAGWFLATLVMVGIRMGGLPLPWKSLFIFGACCSWEGAAAARLDTRKWNAASSLLSMPPAFARALPPAANFWDLNYLLVLIAIAWIWRPGPDSYQYAFSSQIASSEQDAEAGPDSADFDGA